MSGRTPSAAPVTTDPWAAFGYIVSGVAVYGLAGWGLGRWLGASWLVAVGVLVGAVLGIYMVVARFRVGMAALENPPGQHPGENPPATPTDRQSSDGPHAGPEGRRRPAEELTRER